jgi:hypothetical protein
MNHFSSAPLTRPDAPPRKVFSSRGVERRVKPRYLCAVAQFSSRNAVVLALLQVGVLVLGILGAGASARILQAGNHGPTPWLTRVVINYGVASLALPVIWIGAYVRFARRPEASESAKALAFATGLVLLAILSGIVVCGIAQPWMRLDWGLRRPDEI